VIDGLFLVLGLGLLIKGADLLVEGASSVASRFGISPLAIGLTVVSFGTSLPELLVSLTSGLRNSPDLAIASILGSNIANVLLVLGFAAIIRPLPVRDSTVVSEIPFSLTAALLVGFLANLFFFLLFMLYVYKFSTTSPVSKPQISASGTVTRAAAFILLGVVGLYLGGQWVVDGAIGLAQAWGIDDALIGLTIIAFGTSSPELVASGVAAYRGKTDIAVGNVVGSNIFNLLWVLGLTSSIVELPFKVVSNTDLVIVIASSTMIILALVSSRDNIVKRSHGVLFVGLYLVYLTYVVHCG